MKNVKCLAVVALWLAAHTLLFAQTPASPLNQPRPAQPAPPANINPEPLAPADPLKPARPRPIADEEPNLRLNFRGASLETVLNYLSEAAGFIIILDTPIEGKVDVWSNQPLNRAEAIDLLNTILNQKGYAAVRNGRTLRIVSRDNAKKQNIPVLSGSNPQEIPKSDEMVTQILPIRYADAVQLTKDLQPLLPVYAAMTANESGNALVLTATQADIHRMAQIIQALDTSISSISTIRVFPLRQADAKQLATAVKELFVPPQAGNNNNQRNRFQNRFRGEGGGGGGGDRPEGSGESVAREAASRVVAVADERINALIVAAPDEFIPAIEELVAQVDVVVADVTELRVFPLKHADPVEMAEILAGLFPDETTTSNERRETPEFRFFDRGGGGRGNRNNQAATSERAKKQGKVISVPDQRTSSLIVSAASELMPQIAAMLEQLDANAARKQKVFVYSLENADVREVEQVLRDMFQRSNTQNNRTTAEQNSPLENRTLQNQNNTGAATGSTRSGNQGGLNGGQGGQQLFR